MDRKRSRIYIGTSGWQYDHWRGIFYPEELKVNEQLSYYSRHFPTVEINSSFYHLPKETVFAGWVQKTPKDFLFSVKVWRRITHLKKLKNVDQDLKVFCERAKALGDKFGPALFQFPPNFQATEENIKRLEKLSRFIRLNSWSNSRGFASKHCVFEFRHSSWFSKPIYRILKKYKLCLCWADTPSYPYREEVTAGYVYIRLHGHTELYASKYTKKQLTDYAKKIKRLVKLGRDVYVYFDNDAYGYAIENAKQLIGYLGA